MAVWFMSDILHFSSSIKLFNSLIGVLRSWLLNALFSWMTFCWFDILVIFAYDAWSGLDSTCFLASSKEIFCMYFLLIISFSFFQMLHSSESTECFSLQFRHKGGLHKVIHHAQFLVPPHLRQTDVLVQIFWRWPHFWHLWHLRGLGMYGSTLAIV